MGNVRKTAQPHKLRIPKKTKAKLNEVTKKINSKRNESRAKDNEDQEPIKVKSERIEKDKVNPASNKSSVKEGSNNVSSTRVYPPGPKSLTAPAPIPQKTGPASITPPGPSAKALASKKAAAAKKGTKNTSSVKVATPFVDLESDTGGMVYDITDVPRQWKKNGQAQ